MQLDRLPAQTRVYVDANIAIYHFTGASVQCTSFLSRCERGELLGVTGAHVVAEMAHRLMAIEAVRRGLVTAGNVGAKLRAKPDVIRQLSLYQANVDTLMAIGIEVLPVTVDVLGERGGIRSEHGLLVNDSLSVALLQLAHIKAIATSDKVFLRVPGLRVYLPADLPRGVAATS